MLIEDIRSFNVVMPDLMKYLKDNNFNINEFFLKLALSQQYVIIQEFLLIKYDMVLLITPYMVSIKIWNSPFNYTQIYTGETIYTEKVTDIKTKLNHYYTKLITEAFKYIENTPF